MLLIERSTGNYHPRRIPGAEWMLADACELASLEEAGLQSCDVVIAATGDDKVNLVVSLLSKTEFAVRRVVARVNDPRNEWLFTEAWGVDVAVSTPRMLAAMVEEAVNVGDLVRLMTLRQGQANLVEVTLPAATTPISINAEASCHPTGHCSQVREYQGRCAASLAAAITRGSSVRGARGAGSERSSRSIRRSRSAGSITASVESGF